VIMFTKDLLLWIYWNPFKRIIHILPSKFIYPIAGVVGMLFYYVAHNRRNMLNRELNLALGRKTDPGEARQTVREAFKVMMCNELEVLLFPVLNSENIPSFVTCSGFKYLDRALSAGKGAMLLFAHFGANQMVMPAIGYRGYKMSQLSAPATVWKEKMPHRKFSVMEERAMKIRWSHELSLPVRHVNIFGSLREAFLCLKRNQVLGVAIDGGSGKEKTVVRFLGRKASFSKGAVDIAMRTGCAILPTFMVRNESGFNTMVIEPPLLVQVDEKCDANETITRTTQIFVKRLEEYVLIYPDHYINFLALRSIMAKNGDTPLFLSNI